MSTNSAIEWTEATWNPTTGCDRTSPGCDHCLAPDTPVLMADMSWKPIGKVEVGDEVVSFTESPALGQNRVYELATVLKTWTVEKEAVELTVGSRVVVASTDHKFLAAHRPYWREAASLSLSQRLVEIGMPTWVTNTESVSYLDGYVAGAFGGDGTFRIAGSGKNGTLQSYGRVAVLASDRAILDRVARWFVARGFEPPRIQPFDGAGGGFVADTVARQQMLKIETRRQACLAELRAAFIEREEREVNRLRQMDAQPIPAVENAHVPGLRNEARLQIERHKPRTFGDAQRLAGVTAADLAALLIHQSRSDHVHQ